MFKKYILGIGFGVFVGFSINMMMNSPKSVDSEELISAISELNVNILKLSASRHPDNIPSSTNVNENISVSTTDPLILSEIRSLFKELSGELRNELQNSNVAQLNTNSDPATNKINKKLSPEQQNLDSIAVQQAVNYLDEATSRGRWIDSDASNFKQLLDTVPADDRVKLLQEFAAAINDGRIKSDLSRLSLIY